MSEVPWAVRLALGGSLLALVAVGGLLAMAPAPAEAPTGCAAMLADWEYAGAGAVWDCYGERRSAGDLDAVLRLYERMQHDSGLVRALQADPELGIARVSEVVMGDLEQATETRFDAVVPLAEPASSLGRLLERNQPDRYHALQQTLEVAEIRARRDPR